MLRHIVLINFKSGANEAERAAVVRAIEAFRGSMPEVKSLVCGTNVGAAPHPADFAVVIDFDDLAAFRRYLASPQHRAYVEGPAKVAIESLKAIQHEW